MNIGTQTQSFNKYLNISKNWKRVPQADHRRNASNGSIGEPIFYLELSDDQESIASDLDDNKSVSSISIVEETDDIKNSYPLFL